MQSTSAFTMKWPWDHDLEPRHVSPFLIPRFMRYAKEHNSNPWQRKDLTQGFKSWANIWNTPQISRSFWQFTMWECDLFLSKTCSRWFSSVTIPEKEFWMYMFGFHVRITWWNTCHLWVSGPNIYIQLSLSRVRFIPIFTSPALDRNLVA